MQNSLKSCLFNLSSKLTFCLIINLYVSMILGQFGRVYSATMRDLRGKLSGRVAVKTLKCKPPQQYIPLVNTLDHDNIH